MKTLDEEKRKLMDQFNNTRSGYPRKKTIHDLFIEQAKVTPDEIAVYCENEKITYKDLDDQSEQLALYLNKKGYKKQLIALIAERKLNLIIGILGILKSGNAYLPIDPEHPLERNVQILKSSETKVVLTNIPHLSIENVDIINLNDPELYEHNYSTLFNTKSEDLAYVIYTSGSTGIPKGVMVEHRNVVNLIYGMKKNIPGNREGSILSLTTVSFDIFGFELFFPLLHGQSMVFANSDDQYDLRKLLTLIENTNVTILQLTPSRLRLILSDSLAEKIFSKIKILLVGGEEFPASLHKQVCNFSNCKVYNMYGPTETTIYSTFKDVSVPNELNIGKPMINTEIYILNDKLEIRKIGEEGELYISGDGVSRGYYKNEILTKERFIKNPYPGGEKLYKTGDIARWTKNGEIEFIGRGDSQVKIRGYRIELGEIENALLNCKLIENAAVVCRENNEEKYLCGYIILADGNEGLNELELRDYLASVIPEYMIPSYFTVLDKLPLTPSGKIDRKSLPAPEIKAGKNYVAPSSGIENKLVEIWSDILNLSSTEIGIETNFFTIGGHSLKAKLLQGEIQKNFNVDFKFGDVFECNKISRQAKRIEQLDKVNFIPIEKAKVKEYYQLSSAQKRMYLLQQIHPDSVAYNEPLLIPISGNPDKNKIKNVLQELIKRHESLRTAFVVVDGIPMQKIFENVDLKISEHTITDEEIFYRIEEFKTPFDLSTAPLMNCELLNIQGEDSVLHLNLHHIITDGISHDILEKEFLDLYEGKNLRELLLQYKDFSEWERNKEWKEKIEKQEKYWLDKLSGELPVLNIPPDYLRPVEQSHEGKKVSFSLSKEETCILKSFAEKEDITLYMTLFSVFALLVSKLSAQNEILIGTPVAGRNHIDLESIVGMFVNTIVLKIEAKEDILLKDLIQHLKRVSLEAYENQDYQFEDLVSKISDKRDRSRNPIFDVVFDLFVQENNNLSFIDSNKKEYVHEKTISKFDLSFLAIDYGEQIQLSFEYCTKLFKPETIDRYISIIKKIINQVPEKLNNKLAEIDILIDEDRQKLLHEFNFSTSDFPKNKTIDELFEDQVKNIPNSIAVTYKDKCLTYSELNKRSELLAKRIQMKIASNSVIGIMADPSLDMLIGIIGIIKAGCIYMPIASDIPDSRVEYLIKDSGVELLLLANTRKFETDLCEVSEEISLLEQFSDEAKLMPNNTKGVYIIYTSGSTGVPKGVLIEHNSLVNLCYGHNKYYQISKNDNLSKYAGFGFDASVWEIFPSLISGANLVMVDEDIKLDVEELNTFYEKYDITVSFLPTQVCEQFLEYENNSLRVLLTGGDKLNSFKKGNYALYNNYGPTEGTVVTLRYKVTQSSHNIPIGHPIENNKVFILNKNNCIQPVGIPGELCVSGDSLAVGYVNNPELTQKQFIEHPYLSGERLYKTGDLARWLPDGNIEFLGRIDHQVKIRGFRIELGEIETVLFKHKEISECVVKILERENEKYLCAYFVRSFDKENSYKNYNDEFELELRSYLGEALPEYMIPTYFVELDQMPITSNGKIDKRALPEPEIGNKKEYIAPNNRIEETLVNTWSEILNIPEETISTDDSFFVLGGHSLKAKMLQCKISENLNVDFSFKDIFLYKTIKEQAYQIEKLDSKEFLSIPKANLQDSYLLSPAQKRMFLLQQIDTASMLYNIHIIIAFEKIAKKDRVEYALNKLIERHEILRTSFDIINDIPQQVIHHSKKIQIAEYVLSESEFIKRKSKLSEAFNLSQLPLLRGELIHINNSHSAFLIEMHHIISDGVSQSILEKEFRDIYSGIELPEIFLQYKDYSQWLNSDEQQKKIKQQESFWLNQFADGYSQLNLPTDFLRPINQSNEGAIVQFSLNKKETAKLREIAAREDVTLYMLLISAFKIFLNKLSGQQEIILGTPVSGRSHVDVENILGIFINTIIIKSEINDTITIKDYLNDIKRISLEALENQDYQFDDLVNHVLKERDTSRNPIFDVLFNYLNEDESNDVLLNRREENVHVEWTSKFDLSLFAVDYTDQFIFNFEYCTKLFKPSTIDRYIGYFKEIIRKVINNVDEKISEIEFISKNEKRELLYSFNPSVKDYPKHKSIYDLFETMEELYGKEIAIRSKSRTLTYSEFKIEVECMSDLLLQNGAGSGCIIALEQYRSVEMIVTIFAVLKLGCIYLPIDPNYPEDRKKIILQDSKASLFVTSKQAEFFGDDICENVIIKNISNIYIEQDNSIANNDNKNSAYIIYTSGSTGNPKGVLVGHESVINLLYNLQEKYPIDTNGAYLFKTSYCFDVSVSELFGWMLGGGSISILDNFSEKDPRAIIDAIEVYGITHINFVPSMFKMFGDILDVNDRDTLSTLKYMLIAGETLTLEHIKNFVDLNLPAKIENLYGPTESTVFSSIYSINKSEENTFISIGRGLNNLQLYVLNNLLKLQPIGVQGELFIGGNGLANGYVNQPELSKDKFINNPYVPGEKIYKTGDLVKWNEAGNLEFIGRTDHQVKVRGFRIELGEIENVLLRHENINEAIVLAKDGNTGKYLCAYITTCNIKTKNDNSRVELLKNYLSESLPEYMIPDYFVKLESMPLNSNGKVNRKALPEPEIKSVAEYISPIDETEQRLVEIWSEILDIPKEKIGVEESFFSLGGNSLSVISFLSKIQKIFEIKLSYSLIFEQKTIRRISKFVSGGVKNDSSFKEMLVSEKKEYYELSSAQKRMFVLQNSNVKTTAYNIFMFHVFEEGIDRVKLKNAFKSLIQRHESLRTSFFLIDSLPVQRILENVDFSIEYLNSNIQDKKSIKDVIADANIMTHFMRPFDLSKAPLFRIGLIECNNGAIMLIDMHHIISDGWSIRFLADEFINIYEGKELPGLKYQYRDYVESLNQKGIENVLIDQEKYWLDKFNSYQPLLELPFDFERPERQSYEGKYVGFKIEGIKEIVDVLTKSEGYSTFMVFYSILNAFIYKITGSEDITIGFPVSGRVNSDIEKILGMFINTLPLRIKFDREYNFRKLLELVKDEVIGGLENQEYPFDELVNKLKIRRTLGETPLFNVLFDFVSEEIGDHHEYRDDKNGYIHRNGIAKFDFIFMVHETKNEIFLSFTYSTKLFKPETIDRLVDVFKKLTSSMLQNQYDSLSEIELDDNSSKLMESAFQIEEDDFNF